MADQLQVAGECPKCGRKIKTTAPTGRATWRGPCPKRGCDGKIIARRIKAADPPAGEQAPPAAAEQPAAGEQAPPAKSTKGRRPVVKVSGYERTLPSSTDGKTAGVPSTSDAAGGRPATGGRKPAAADGSGKPPAGERAGTGQQPPAKRTPARSAHPETGKRDHHPYGHLFGW